VRFFPVASEVVGTPSFEVALESAVLWWRRSENIPNARARRNAGIGWGPAYHRGRNYEPEAHAN